MNANATLRRIDEEINATRQQIAALQVNIVRLEDARRVFMGMAEADAAHGAAGGGIELLPGAHARPQLIVRKTGSEHNGKRVSKLTGRRIKGTRRDAYRKEILAAAANGEEVTSDMVGERIGLPVGAARHQLREVFRQLAEDGVLDRHGHRRKYSYTLKETPPS